MSKNKPINGIYQHFKGKKMEVIGVALHSETLDQFVVYKELDNNSIWIRPLDMFNENVEFNGKIVPRFKYIKQ